MFYDQTGGESHEARGFIAHAKVMDWDISIDQQVLTSADVSPSTAAIGLIGSLLLVGGACSLAIRSHAGVDCGPRVVCLHVNEARVRSRVGSNAGAFPFCFTPMTERSFHEEFLTNRLCLRRSDRGSETLRDGLTNINSDEVPRTMGQQFGGDVNGRSAPNDVPHAQATAAGTKGPMERE